MKTKKLLSALLSVLIVLMMLPTAAFADGTVIPPTTLIVGGVEVVKNGEVQSYTPDTTWSYDHSTATLTLNGATINGVASTPNGAGIYSEGGTLTIEFSGNNTVTGVVPDVGSGSDSSSVAIDAASDGSLIFSGSERATLTAKGGDSTLFGYGVFAAGSVTVTGGTLTATGGMSDSLSYGVYAEVSITVTGGTLEATGGTVNVNSGDSCGVRINGGITVSGTGKVIATGDTATGLSGSSYGVYADSVTVTSGTLTAKSGEATANSYGVYAFSGGVTVSGGTLTATGGGATYGDSYGVYAAGSVEVSGTGMLTANSGEATFSYGVHADSVTVSGGKLDATGGEATFSYGVYALEGSVTVSGGTVTATGDEATNGNSYGVYAVGGVEVSGGTVTATGDEATNGISYGVYADGDVEVSGTGTLTATGGTATGLSGSSYGVRAAGDVEVSGTGTLTATGGTATGLSGSSYGVYGVGGVTVGSSDSSGAVLVANGTNSAITQNLNSLVMQNGSGTVIGNVTLKEDLTVPTGGTLTIPADATLTIQDGAALTNKGTIIVKVGGTLTGNVTGNPAESVPQIITGSLNSATVGTAYSQKLEATGNNIIWSVSNGTLPDGLALNESTGEIFGTPNAEDTSTFTVKAENSAGSDTEQFTLTVNKATVAVSGVTLNPTTLTLDKGATAQLTATVEPDNATNKNVTWSSDNPDVATVDQTGKVTAVKEGTATITVKTTDGNYTASCAVTVNKPAPAEFVITFDPNGGYVSYTSAVTSGGKLSALPFASKYGYTFTGWYTSNGYPVSTDTIFTGNATLYAGWVYNGIDIPEQPVNPVKPQEPEYEWISEDGGTRLYYDGEMITGWYQDEETGVWYWLDKSSGFMAADQWVKIDGNWYLFDKDGSMLTGWQKVDGKWYYLKPWGGMATGWQYIDNVWYYLRSDGSMAGNAWVMTSGQWYYLTGSGEMATNKWVEWKGDWYFLYSSGVMATNTTIDGYTINSAGIWVK